MVPFRGCSTDSQRFWTTPYSSLHVLHGFPVFHFIAKPHKTISSAKRKLCVKFNWMQVTASDWLGYLRAETINFTHKSPLAHISAKIGKIQIPGESYSVKVWLDITTTIMVSCYNGILDTFMIPKLQFYCFDSWQGERRTLLIQHNILVHHNTI